ncbi:MAG: hypothetical protein PHO62_10955 [Sulfurimonas sp.]|uniref:hypothetical protein n=1 Tax=Sulfurimonas sp. TaxID=2022749 RepID=UPI00261E2285|nr:hypothetical protein [Sulfurimonas sp.]MDD5373929.1 hypothetical protein [Sulfurimonas sp.]
MKAKKSSPSKPPFDKEKLRQHVKFFINRRYDFVLVAIAIAYFNVSSSLNNALDLLKQKDSQIVDLAQRTTYITDGGVIKQYEKEKFDVYNQKDNVAKVMADYLINSAFVLTDAYKTKIFGSEEDLYKSTKEFQLFYKSFIEINPRISTQKAMDDFEIVKKDWKQILRWFAAAINENNLPHTMDKKISNIEFVNWNTDKNTFTIKIKVPIFVKSINKLNIDDAGLSEASITATGYYDLQQKSLPNPYGMKFTSLTLAHPVINHTKMQRSEKQ